MRNIYPRGCIHCVRHCTDTNKTNDKYNNTSLSDLLPAGANYTAVILQLNFEVMVKITIFTTGLLKLYVFNCLILILFTFHPQQLTISLFSVFEMEYGTLLKLCMQLLHKK